MWRGIPALAALIFQQEGKINGVRVSALTPLAVCNNAQSVWLDRFFVYIVIACFPGIVEGYLSGPTGSLIPVNAPCVGPVRVRQYRGPGDRPAVCERGSKRFRRRGETITQASVSAHSPVCRASPAAGAAAPSRRPAHRTVWPPQCIRGWPARRAPRNGCTHNGHRSSGPPARRGCAR